MIVLKNSYIFLGFLGEIGFNKQSTQFNEFYSVAGNVKTTHALETKFITGLERLRLKIW